MTRKFNLSRTESIFRSDKSDFLTKIRGNRTIKSIQINLIEISSVVNPSDLSIRIHGYTQKFSFEFCNHKKELLLQNGIFTFYVPDNLKSQFTLDLRTTENMEAQFMISVFCEGSEEFNVAIYYSAGNNEEEGYPSI